MLPGLQILPWRLSAISLPARACQSNGRYRQCDDLGNLSTCWRRWQRQRSVLLTVTDPVLDSITITPANSSVAGFSKTVPFTATGIYSDGSTTPVTAIWSSSATSVATIVASSGIATTVAAGTTIISANLNGIIGSTRLTVTSPVLITDGLKITPVSPIQLAVNASQQLIVTATFTDDSTQNVATGSAWTSSLPTICSVNTTGLITGISAGTATITAQYGGQFVTTLVVVN